MAAFSDFRKLVGCKVFVTLSDSNQTFEGLLHNIIESRSSIILRQITIVPSDGRVFEQLEFGLKDIFQILPLSNDEVKEANSSDALTTDNQHSNSSRLKPYSSFFNKLYYDKLKSKAMEHIYLKEMDSHFNEALNTIKKLNLIAVTGEGSDEGRFGLMSVLGIATFKAVYLFDVVNLGEKVFTSGNSTLKRVLESKDVLKIVHNCRLLSDNLFNKYKVKLTNVFDTQVMYSVIKKNQEGFFPNEAVSLAALLSALFNLPEEICKEVHSLEEWRRRPLTTEMLGRAAWKVTVLFPCKKALENALFYPFENFCELYTTVVRDCDLFEARTSLSRNMLLPREMTEAEGND